MDVLTFEKWQQLDESPTVIMNEVNPEYISKKLITPINKAIKNNSIYYGRDNIFSIPLSKYSGIYLVAKDNVIFGACLIKSVNYCGKTFIQPEISKKFEYKYNGLLKELYSYASDIYGVPIISDSLQSLDSSSIWRKWYNNPQKYDIKEIKAIKAINVEDCKQKYSSELDVWGLDIKKSKILVTVSFN